MISVEDVILSSEDREILGLSSNGRVSNSNSPMQQINRGFSQGDNLLAIAEAMDLNQEISQVQIIH